MKVSTGPEFFESVANHPRVLPYVTWKGIYAVGLKDVWKDCVGLEFDTGGWVFHRLAPDVYEVHTLFLPKSVNVSDKAQEALAYMFSNGAQEILTRVPHDLPHVRRLAEKGGFTFLRRHEIPWQRETGPVETDVYQLTQEAWVSQQGR
jgi:hypothetical protein